MTAKQSLLAAGNHTIFSLIARFTPLYFTTVPLEHTYVFQAMILLFLTIWLIWLWQMGKIVKNSEVLEAAIIISLIPLLSFTSYNAFGFSELAVCLGLYYFREMNTWAKATTVAGMIMLG